MNHLVKYKSYNPYDKIFEKNIGQMTDEEIISKMSDEQKQEIENLIKKHMGGKIKGIEKIDLDELAQGESEIKNEGLSLVAIFAKLGLLSLILEKVGQVINWVTRNSRIENNKERIARIDEVIEVYNDLLKALKNKNYDYIPEKLKRLIQSKKMVNVNQWYKLSNLLADEVGIRSLKYPTHKGGSAKHESYKILGFEKLFESRESGRFEVGDTVEWYEQNGKKRSGKITKSFIKKDKQYVVLDGFREMPLNKIFFPETEKKKILGEAPTKKEVGHGHGHGGIELSTEELEKLSIKDDSQIYFLTKERKRLEDLKNDLFGSNFGNKLIHWGHKIHEKLTLPIRGILWAISKVKPGTRLDNEETRRNIADMIYYLFMIIYSGYKAQEIFAKYDAPVAVKKSVLDLIKTHDARTNLTTIQKKEELERYVELLAKQQEI